MYSNTGTTGNIKDKLKTREFSVLSHCPLLLLIALSKALLYTPHPISLNHLAELPISSLTSFLILPSLFLPPLSACLAANPGFQEKMLLHDTLACSVLYKEGCCEGFRRSLSDLLPSCLLPVILLLKIALETRSEGGRLDITGE